MNPHIRNMFARTMSQVVPPGNSLVDAFRWRAAAQPDDVAFVFLGHEEDAPKQVTYQELDARAEQIANHLLSHGLQGQRALLVFDPGLDFIAAFFGCLYAGVTAVPAYPPDPMRLHRTLGRLLGIVRDCDAKVLLTTMESATVCGTLFQESDSLQYHFEVDQLRTPPTLDENFSLPDHDPRALALLQYTSGSTGDPKGVMVTHENLLQNMRQVHRLIDMDGAVMVSWLPVYHDMGLLAGVLQPWFNGRLSVLMSPVQFFQKPFRWLKAISDYRATTTAGPDFGYDICIRKTTMEQRAELDLSSWSIAINGSEPVRPATMERFCEAFRSTGLRSEVFYPSYGMAEATLFVSGGDRQEAPVTTYFDVDCLTNGRAMPATVESDRVRELVACGAAVDSMEVAIVCPQSHRRLEGGQIGEVWLAGPNVAAGYWNRPELTAEIFSAHTADGEGPWLRTGDLGFFFDGQLFLTGRHKDILIHAGCNHCPHDIELTVESCEESLKPHGGAVFSVEDGQHERIVIVHEVMRPGRLELDKVMADIAAKVTAEHFLPVDAIVLVKPGTVPKTTSGKVQRSRCRELYLEGKLSVVHSWSTERHRRSPEQMAQQYVPPNSLTEKMLAEMWGEVLGMERVGIHDDFFDLGGHSLLATQLAQQLSEWLPHSVEIRQLMDRPTIAELAAWIDTQPLAAPDDVRLLEMLNSVDHITDDQALEMLQGIWGTPSPIQNVTDTSSRSPM